MSELIKIKMSDAQIDSWPLFLQEAVKDHDKFCLIIEPERKLCSSCDYLVFDKGTLQYISSEFGKMSFNFEETMLYHKRQRYALTKEPLARALGIKGDSKGENKRIIWDATCGTGKDTLLISYFGAHLTSFERHPLIYLLLQDALRRFPLDIDLRFQEAKISGNNLPAPEVIYFDPMYPSKKKSALPRKEMLIFKDIVGEDLDASEFLEWALTKATERVVVKRPNEAVPLKLKPTASYTGKSTRYDMYKIF